MRTGHLSVRRNKRVIIMFRDGRQVVDRFKERVNGYVYFEKLGKVNSNELRCIGIYKGQEIGRTHAPLNA